jgi:hypothetical protein
MTSNGLLIIPVFTPLLVGFLLFILPRDLGWVREGLALLAAGMSVVAALVIFLGAGGGLRWEFSFPALEVHFNFHAPEVLGLNLVIVSAMEGLILLLLVFAGPRRLRSNEYLFFFLYAFGVANGILLSDEYVEMMLFGELLFVTIYGVTSLLALLSCLSSKETPRPDEAGHAQAFYHWANSRVFNLFELGIIQWVKVFVRLIYVTIDRGIDDLYEKWMAEGGKAVTVGLKAAHNGLYANYLSWSLGGFILLVWFLSMGTW